MQHFIIIIFTKIKTCEIPSTTYQKDIMLIVSQILF